MKDINDKKKRLITTRCCVGLLFTGLLSACQNLADNDNNNASDNILVKNVGAEPITSVSKNGLSTDVQLSALEDVLVQVNDCNTSITIRSQALTQAPIDSACKTLISRENKFHQMFNTFGKPVVDDNNHSLRANFYHTRDDYVKYATAHFNMPTNNGGMYLEGYPDRKNNHAEFVAYEKNGALWNLEHEYVHYLDGRYNRYGDYCSGLHDDHEGPEFCPKPNLTYPHGVWWSEGIAEYLAKGDNNPKAQQLAITKQYPLSELFNTSYNENTGGERVYQWGYLAVRFMMEQHRDKVEQSLLLSRQGDWVGYQDLLRSWSDSMDQQWFDWLGTI